MGNNLPDTDPCPQWCDGHPDGSTIDGHIGLLLELPPNDPTDAGDIRRLHVTLEAPRYGAEPRLVLRERFPGSMNPAGQSIAMSWSQGMSVAGAVAKAHQRWTPHGKRRGLPLAAQIAAGQLEDALAVWERRRKGWRPEVRAAGERAIVACGDIIEAIGVRRDEVTAEVGAYDRQGPRRR